MPIANCKRRKAGRSLGTRLAVGSFPGPSVNAVSRMLQCSAEPGNKANAAVNYHSNQVLMMKCSEQEVPSFMHIHAEVKQIGIINQSLNFNFIHQ